MLEQQSGENGPLRPAEVATALLGWGFDPLPVARDAKNPNRPEWQQERYGPEQVERAFPCDGNVGVQLGPEHGRALDVDLDTVEAGRVGARCLPATGLMWGRASKPRSHYVYRLAAGDPLTKPLVFDDPTPGAGLTKRLLELRWKGQTIAPGSTNIASGHVEHVRWEPDGCGAPAEVTSAALIPLAKRIAAAALLARYWYDGGRHDMALPLAGFLYHGGMSLANALTLMEDVCAAAQDDEVNDRLGCVDDTYRHGDEGQPVTGGPTLVLEDCLSDAQVRKLRDWLSLKARKQVGILGPDNLPLASDGDGDRFANRWGGQVLYCAQDDEWYLYDEVRWKLDEVKHIRELANVVVADFRRLVGERQGACGTDGIADYRTCALYSAKMGDDSNISAMLRAAQSKPEIRVTRDAFDRHPLMLNVKNGTLDLDTATGAIRVHLHDAADRLRSLAPINYYPDATHPLVDLVRARFYPEDERWALYQEFGGYALTGVPKRHALQLIGPHDAGKSLSLKILASALGEYAASLSSTNLTRNPHRGGDVGRPDL